MRTFLCLLITVVIFFTSCKKTDPVTETLTPAISDIDGNTYKTITIGTQVWMAENLKTTKFKDGTAIPLVTDNTAWNNLSTPGYCWYNNDATTNKNTYGAFYNWYTVNTGKLCPTGWHVSTHLEWKVLTNYLLGEIVAGGKLKETGTSHWHRNSASNSTGFTALPGGLRYRDGIFNYIGIGGYWWSSTSYANFAWYRNMIDDSYEVYLDYQEKASGFSVRCLKD